MHLTGETAGMRAKACKGLLEEQYTESFLQSFQRLQKNNELAFLPFILQGIATNTELMQEDLIHPTAEAQALILENVWPILKPIL